MEALMGGGGNERVRSAFSYSMTGIPGSGATRKIVLIDCMYSDEIIFNVVNGQWCQMRPPFSPTVYSP